MAFHYTTSTGHSDYIHDVVGFTRVGHHTYELIVEGAYGKLGKTRVTDVVQFSMNYSCLCHGGN